MERRFSNGKVILVDSPVEFIVIGPIRDQLKVLIKSKKAGIDLVGFSQEENSDLYYKNTFFMNSLVPQIVSSKNFNQIRYTFVDVTQEIDQKEFRPSLYKFVWRGARNKKINREINYHFDSKLPDIIDSIQTQDLERLEWTLATIISLCNISIVNNKTNKNFVIFTAILYSIIILATLYYYINTLF
ncbi:hypothetical protein QQY79_09170 [Flavobacterium tructae]|uniref:hypothetical protein n=1 Tax=Flavobacterium tructae TaxID=1114873 RepID=UPI002551D848|nr:hypothetical protein [Flavobacterium tructae]MDL2142690.1 hypothetical protein [Flavobacterium tructae]